jgi:FKBP-type peptidyl-prolyl cis-trans isomerase
MLKSISTRKDRPVMSPVYKLFTVLLTVGLLVGLAAAPAAAAEEDMAAEGDSQTFYALGVALSQSLAQFSLTEEELAAVQRGLGDGVLGKADSVNLQEYAPKLQALAQERAHAKAQMEREAGSGVVEAAAAEEGAVTTESGMVYKAIEEGTGASPAATDTVKVHYKGTLRDGSTFDSSYDRGQPATFPLNQVIPCWTEGVQKMKVGGKAKLTCPPDVAYGDRPNASIPAGSTLTFEVELLEIVAAPAAAEGGDEG